MSHVDSQHEHSPQDEWAPCQGEISQMVCQLDKLERRKRFRQLTRTAAVSIVSFALGAIVIGGFVVYQEPQFGGIGCTECLSHAGEYRDHLAGVKPMADTELAGKIKTHLELCKCCGAKFREAYPDVSLAALGMEHPPTASYQVPFMLAEAIPGY